MSNRIVFYEYGGPEVLRLRAEPAPDAGAGQVRVRVRAAGVNPVDCKIRSGFFASAGTPDTFPKTLGNEFAGVVDQVAEGVSGVSVGDEVLGFVTARAYAEHVVVSPDAITSKPAGLAWGVAGSLSAVGQTAWNAVEELRVGAGETLLVHAAAGGVGTVAIQLAVRRGATVIGTASEHNHDYLRSLGAVPVRYGAGLVERIRRLAPGGADAALDAAGGEAVAVSVTLVPDMDRIGTLVDDAAVDTWGIRRLRGARSTQTLATLAELCAAGELRLPVSTVFPLKDAAQAHREVETRHVRGKIALTVD